MLFFFIFVNTFNKYPNYRLLQRVTKKNCILNLSFSMFIPKTEFNSQKIANFTALKC